MLLDNFFIVILCMKSVVGELDVLQMRWLEFKETHDKVYKSLREDTLRQTVYIRNLQKITQWNQDYAKGLVSFAKGENEFSDRTSREFESLKGLVLPSSILRRVLGYPPLAEPPKINCTLDLRQNPCLGPVKNQGLCGACYSFPPATMAEFRYCRTVSNTTDVDFSEQQCVDCTGRYGTRGCSGGFYEACLTYWKKDDNSPGNKVEREEDYPYEAKMGTCRTVQGRGVTYVSPYSSLTPWDEGAMQDTLCVLQEPMAVAIHATSNFNQYRTGVFSDPSCENYMRTGNTYVNHAVTIVGLGQTPEGVDYWLVRNSWGATWGENGYMRIKKGENMCNIGIDPVVLKR